MNVPTFQEEVLRKPEYIQTLLTDFEKDASLEKYKDIAVIARICLASSATNDYLEKIGAESIGAKHLSDKLGADGDLHGEGVEVKPFKKSPGSKAVAVINDDTPMKLLKSHRDIQWLVILCANPSGTKVLYALCAPFHYWEQSRYTAIVKRLKLTTDTGWSWDAALPNEASQRQTCFEELVKKHQPLTYVRSSCISLDVLEEIPREEISFWVHPDLPKKKLHPLLRKL